MGAGPIALIFMESFSMRHRNTNSAWKSAGKRSDCSNHRDFLGKSLRGPQIAASLYRMGDLAGASTRRS